MDKSNILTIVIPVYNREQLILNALESIALQECDDRVKIIVVDDKSTDSTVLNVMKWIESHSHLDIKLLTNSKKGVSSARNRGLNDVDTEFVMFFDSDDQMVPGFLGRLVDKLDNTNADLIGWDVNFTGIGKRKRIFKESKVWCNHLVHGILSTQLYVARLSLFNSAGGWNESLQAWVDYELGVRLLLLNPIIEKFNIEYTRTINVNYTKNSITGAGYYIDPEKWIAALDSVENLIIKYVPDKIGWVQYRRAILAAEFSRAKLSDDASRQLTQAMVYNQLPDYCVKSIFHLHKIFKRGTWVLASCFIQK